MSKRCVTPEEKAELLEKILKIWVEHPHQRLCQLLVNSSRGDDIFYKEDDELLRDLEQFTLKFGGTQH
jgi:hypothetical protein